MVKNEQSMNTKPSIRPVSTASTISIPQSSLPSSLSMFQTTPGVFSHRAIDNNAIDITSIKGQFAWEKIPLADTYMPVIFRGDTKYFSIRMLRKLLPDHPEDIIRRTHQYQYRRTFDVYTVTASETDLLNRINSHHARWSYSRQPFTAHDEIVRVSDFLPFYEHLRHGPKATPSLLSNVTVNTLRQLLPQAQQVVQRSADAINSMPTILRTQPSAPQNTSLQTSTYNLPSGSSRDSMPSNVRPIAPALNIPRPPRPLRYVGNPYAVVLPTRPVQYPLPQQQQLVIPSLSSNTTNSISAVPLNNPPAVSTMTPLSLPPSTGSSSSSSVSSLSPIVPSSTNDLPPSLPSVTSTNNVPPPLPSVTPTPPSIATATTLNRKSSTSSVSSSSTITTTLSSKPQLHSGWLQINKLYTPYVSSSDTNHHLYKIPVSLLSFYGLLKTSSLETNDPNDSSLTYDHTLVTSQEIELINDLCIKQNIKPLAVDTKLITLSTFYRYSSANILFVKELPTHEPKSSICKDWPTIVQINGGICRLRNTATLNEQTVPFIGNNLLKNFILSTKTLTTAALSKPTTDELEFLQLVLFFSNLSINLRNAQLIDIESVRKEYNVDLILLFNDKFPVNVLNYQEQGNRSNTSQESNKPSNSTAPTNTIAESTPPPSPPSPPAAIPQPTNPAQLPLTPSTNRCHKTIEFHGHPLTAYICSGLGTNTQRECISIKSLCNILYPNSPLIDKLEIKMLKVLRSKNINRFRPQNQQSMGLTRLIDIKDAEKHWNYIEQEMQAMFNDNEEGNNIRASISSVSTENSKASTVERVEIDKQPLPETSVEVNKGEKRPLDEPLDEEDIPVLERINKRVKVTENESHNQVTEISNKDAQSTDNKKPKKRTIKLTSLKNQKKRPVPSTRANKQSIATWVRKYNLEDCSVLLNKLDPIYDTERD